MFGGLFRKSMGFTVNNHQNHRSRGTTVDALASRVIPGLAFSSPPAVVSLFGVEREVTCSGYAVHDERIGEIDMLKGEDCPSPAALFLL